MYVPNMGAVTLAEAVSAATAAKQNQNPNHASAAGISATAVGISAVSCTTTAGVAGATTGIAAASAAACC